MNENKFNGSCLSSSSLVPLSVSFEHSETLYVVVMWLLLLLYKVRVQSTEPERRHNTLMSHSFLQKESTLPPNRLIMPTSFSQLTQSG